MTIEGLFTNSGCFIEINLVDLQKKIQRSTDGQTTDTCCKVMTKVYGELKLLHLYINHTKSIAFHSKRGDNFYKNTLFIAQV